MSAQVREARQATLELLGYRFDVLPLFGGTEWCVTVFHAGYEMSKSFYRPVRAQALSAALDHATMQEGTAERHDTDRAPAMGDEHAAE